MTSDPDKKGQPGPGVSGAAAALSGLCPRCGAKTLFSGWVAFSARCRSCGLAFSKFNVGDGPAAFLTMIIGAVVVILAIWLQLAAEPPFWVHILLWVPLTTAAVMFGLRVSKAALLWSEFQQKAGEGRQRSDEDG